MTTVPASTGCVPSTRHPLREIPGHTAALELIAGIVDRTLDREPTERPHLKPGPNRRPGPRGANGARYLLPPVIIFQPQKFWLCRSFGERRVSNSPDTSFSQHNSHPASHTCSRSGQIVRESTTSRNQTPEGNEHTNRLVLRTGAENSSPSRRSRTCEQDLPHCGMGHEGCTRTEATIYSEGDRRRTNAYTSYNLYKKTALTGCRQTPIGRFLNPINFFEPGRNNPAIHAFCTPGIKMRRYTVCPVYRTST